VKYLATLLCFAAITSSGCKSPKPEVQGPPEPAEVGEEASEVPAETGEVVTTEAGPEQAPVNEPPPKEWGPPAPEDDGWVWIRMKNGEWFKGELTVVRKDSVEFESDEVGDLDLDFDDIDVFRCPKLTTVRLNDERIIVGTLLVQGDQAVMQTPDGEEVTFARDELYTILPGAGDRASLWSGTLTLGFTGRSGNTDQIDTSVYLLAQRRSAKSRYTFVYTATYSEISSSVVANNQRIDTDYRYYLNRRTYVTPISVSLFRDPFQNLDLRATPGFGAGYQILDSSNIEWDVDAGLGALYTRFDTVQPGEDDSTTSVAILLGTGLHDDLTSKLELNCLYNVQIPLDSSLPNHHAELRTSLDLWKDMDMDVAFIWDHQGSPVPDSNGVLPESDDYRLVFGLGWDF
jgi:hypothetical protein